jgi:precorrin-3B synthase
VYQALAAARFGRVNAATLGALGHLLRRHRLTTVRITPWRAFAFTCSCAAQAAAVFADAASIGLLTDRQDPALGVIACIGAAGCWQTQLDTLSEAERFVANRPAELEPGALVHVSGCDKFCATRAPVALTLLGRTDQTGFDALALQVE